MAVILNTGGCCRLFATKDHFRSSRPIFCHASLKDTNQANIEICGRRDLILKSSSFGSLAAVFGLSLGDSQQPSGIGLNDFGDENKQLGLCPKSPPCISTAEVMNNDSYFVPPWTYNPTTGKRRKNPITKEKAMTELKEVVSNLKPDKFEPTIVKETSDYLYVTYKSPFFGFVDDVEFYFPAKNSEVEYRSASRIGDRDFDINRKRIRAIRKELEKKGWLSAGY